MRRLWIPMVALAVVGCGTTDPAPPPPAGPADGELVITIEPLTSGWIVHTNRPASVAMFEIIPNRGVGLLFPEPGEDEGRVEAGSTRILTRNGRTIDRHRAAYLELPSTFMAGGEARRAMETLTHGNTPRTIVAVACACTLRLDDLARPDGPEDVVGAFAAVTAGAATPKLLAAVLPDADVLYGTTFAYDRYTSVVR